MAPLLITSIIYLSLITYGLYNTFLIHLFIRKKGNSNEIDEEINSITVKRQKSLKLTSFTNKMWQYPSLGLLFVIPIMIYSWLEYFKDKHIDEISYLKTRFVFYNINCFLNSIRGYMQFKVFMSNEKIKMFLFKKYLTSSIFYSIDKMKDKKEDELLKIIKEKQVPLIGSFINNNDGKNNEIIEKKDDPEISINLNDRDNYSVVHNRNNIEYLEVDDDDDDINLNNFNNLDSKSQKINIRIK